MPEVLGWSLVRCEVWKHSAAYALIHSNPRPCPYHVLVSAERSKITQYGSCRRRVRHDTVSINVHHYTPDTTRQDKKHRCRLLKPQITPPAPSASPCTRWGRKHRHLLFVQHWTRFTNTPTKRPASDQHQLHSRANANCSRMICCQVAPQARAVVSPDGLRGGQMMCVMLFGRLVEGNMVCNGFRLALMR
jgi:hypothetical protein